MDFDLNWILLGLPVAFALGWLASRLDFRQLRIDNRQAPRAYFKGLNFLLNEQQDQAIDAFIEAVQNDPDTSELHFALGNLFRRRGEYERAVRVHEHLLSRADLGRVDRERAQHALALDFLKAGLLDRAEDALRKLEGTPFETQARLALLAIYERSREWPQATEITQKLQAAGQGDFAVRQSHYLCEQAAAASVAQQTVQAEALLRQAIEAAPGASRPRLDLASLQAAQGQPADAYATLVALVEHAPTALPLAAVALAQAAQASGQSTAARHLLVEHYGQRPSVDIVEALVLLDSTLSAPQQDWYIQHLRHEPSLIAVSRWLAPERLADPQQHPQIQRALDERARPLKRYRCAACGFEAQTHFWHCPGCQAWDSYPPVRVEEL
ncbi:MAG: Lipopolysaccharide assembly protein B [Paracidovorax wautersii]|uniref:Lipopolysaccharide assembly protein B n=1 Tax=Paracidovorax wautersii TaxID=1177982 RepID=A0A7V8FLW0_9BURK|nr:MAG: Lipopolysaccharide assembly protein B [Paracidovorax wautersii]